jgi:hypothetical protein
MARSNPDLLLTPLPVYRLCKENSLLRPMGRDCLKVFDTRRQAGQAIHPRCGEEGLLVSGRR